MSIILHEMKDSHRARAQRAAAQPARRRKRDSAASGVPGDAIHRACAARVAPASGHLPVLASELTQMLALEPGAVVVDCTFGGGGHARAVAGRIGPTGTLVAIDRDPQAESAFAALATEVRCSVRFIRGAYAESLQMLREEGLQADAVYFDLGMSSMQIDTRERGFSYSYDAPLDMRMDPRQQLSARDIVAGWEERRLAATIRELGEERYATQIARAIARRRQAAPIETTLQLVETINSAIPAPSRFGGGHPAKRVFQALRIAVNDELRELEQALPLAWGLLRDDRVLAAISFHSLEDRRVKRFLVEKAAGCICPPDLPVCACGRQPEAALICRGAITPTAEELACNPRSASARLRGARKLAGLDREARA